MSSINYFPIMNFNLECEMTSFRRVMMAIVRIIVIVDIKSIQTSWGNKSTCKSPSTSYKK